MEKLLDNLFWAQSLLETICFVYAFLCIRWFDFIFFEEGIMDVPSLVKNNPNEVIILQMLQELPLSSILIGMYALISIIFVCTTYDSCSYVLASIATNKSSKQPSKVLRLIFAGILVVQPGVIMFLEGIDSIKYILLISSIPYCLFLLC